MCICIPVKGTAVNQYTGIQRTFTNQHWLMRSLITEGQPFVGVSLYPLSKCVSNFKKKELYNHIYNNPCLGSDHHLMTVYVLVGIVSKSPNFIE